MLALSLVLLVTYLLFAQTRSGWSALLAGDNTTAVWTYHNDNLRSGQNLNETILNTGDVNAKQFGKRVSYPVDGQVYAQPLFVPAVTIRGHQYNVAYVATENDSVYAFDADQRRAVAPLWKTSFLHLPEVTTVPPGDVFVKYPNHDIQPSIGITSTPVIDLAAKTLYVVAMTKQRGDQYVQQLHALDITTGKDRPGSPVAIFATVKGAGYDKIVGANASSIPFNSREGNQRAALLLAYGVIYIAWGGFGDTDPYHGWVVGYTYNGKTFRQASVYNATPDGQEGGIWMSGAGPSADGQGNVYLTTGNGTFDLGQAGQRDAGDSFIKLSTRHGLTLTDYFTPFNQQCLDGRDEDLGSGGVLLLPDQSDTTHPHLIVAVGKEGRIYVIDRDHMGRFQQYPASLQCNTSAEERTDIDHVIQELPSDTTGGFLASRLIGMERRTAGNSSTLGELAISSKRTS